MSKFLETHLNSLGIKNFSLILEENALRKKEEIRKIVKSLPDNQRGEAVKQAIEILNKLRELKKVDGFSEIADKLEPIKAGESNDSASEDNKEKLTPEEQEKEEQKQEELKKENQETIQQVKDLEEKLKKVEKRAEELESKEKKRIYLDNVRKSVRNDWNQIVTSWVVSCGELGVKCNLSLSDFEGTKKRINQKYEEKLKAETQKNDWLERQLVIDVYNTRIDPLLKKIQSWILPQAQTISNELGIDIDDLFPPKITEN